ncbi:MAG: ribonuclease III [Lachnospiraceae bacterium]|nr:ribonuclease III [Lachnospiraceae bacterium]
MGNNEIGGAELLYKIEELWGEPHKDLKTYSGLTLAYIGDAVYDIVVRTILVARGNAPVNKLHNEASSIVKAEAQKNSLQKIESLLTEEEMAVYKRGRNSKSYTTAKNASVTDYRIATGYEALIGYLYLDGQTDRLLYLIKEGIS